MDPLRALGNPNSAKPGGLASTPVPQAPVAKAPFAAPHAPQAPQRPSADPLSALRGAGPGAGASGAPSLARQPAPASMARQAAPAPPPLHHPPQSAYVHQAPAAPQAPAQSNFVSGRAPGASGAGYGGPSSLTRQLAPAPPPLAAAPAA